MAWQWVSNLMAPDNKKTFWWDARCPYALCPGNFPDKKKAKLRFVQRHSFFVNQYRCGYCGNVTNFSIEQPNGGVGEVKKGNPAFWGKPDYKFHK